MLAMSADTLPIGADWTYEVKWDGYRTLAAKDGQRVRLWSRNLKDATAQYPSIARSIAEVHTDTALLDGEIVALDENGRPSFQALHHQSAHILVYYAFDLLHVNGRDTIKVPLTDRRSQLGEIVASTRVLSSDPLPGTPGQIEQAVRGLQLEGMVAKRQHSIYEPGRRSSAWVKVKFNRRQEFVVGGYKPNATNVESLVVGYYEAGKLHFAGRVRAGLTPSVRADIFRRLAPDRIDRCPFADLPNTRKGHWGEGVTAEDMVNLRWVKPRLVIEVSFVEWTRDGALRHSEFVALRTDKRASDVGRG